MPKLEVYTVEFYRPDNVTVHQMQSYIREAIEMWGGQRRPEDPLFYPWRMTGSGLKDRLPRIRVRRRYP